MGPRLNDVAMVARCAPRGNCPLAVGYNIRAMQTLSTNQFIRSALVLATAGMAVMAAGVVDDWLGDWVAMLWLVGPFIGAFFAGMTAGPIGHGAWSVVVGAVIGMAIVVLPSVGFLLASVGGGQEASAVIADHDLWRLWGFFTPLGAMQGALFWLMGITSREFFNKLAHG